MKTCFFNFPKKGQSYAQIIDKAKAVGFDAVELYTACELISPDTDAAKSIGEYAGIKQIDIGCISVGANLTREDNTVEVEKLKKYVDVAKIVGSPFLHHTLGSALHWRFEPIPVAKIINRIVKAEREVCDYAGEKGIMVLNENQGFIMNGIERFDEYLSVLDHPNHGLVADVGNIMFVGEKPESFVGRFAPFIKHLHVKDYLLKPGAGLYPGNEWLLTNNGDYLLDTVIGYGAVDFEKVFHILISAGYDGYYSMECGAYTEEPDRLAKGLRNIRFYYENTVHKLSHLA